MTSVSSGRPALARRGFIFGSASLTWAVLCGCDQDRRIPAGEARKAHVGFTLATPEGDCSSFRRDLGRVTDLGGDSVRFALDYYDAVQDWDPQHGLVWNPTVLSRYTTAFNLADAAGVSVALMTVNGVEDDDFERYLDIMAEYWGTVSRLFGDRAAVWQVFNEADGMDFQLLTPVQDQDFENYLDRLNAALEVARRSIHTHAPSVSLTTNASGYPVDRDLNDRWVRYFDPIAEQLDILSVDAYPTLDAEAVAAIPGMLQDLSNRFRLPVGVMEFGLQTGVNLYSEEQQTRAITMLLQSLAASVGEYAMVYRLRDNGDVGDDGFGLYTIDGRPKSSVEEVARCIRHNYA